MTKVQWRGLEISTGHRFEINSLSYIDLCEIENRFLATVCIMGCSCVAGKGRPQEALDEALTRCIDLLDKGFSLAVKIASGEQVSWDTFGAT